MREYLVIYEEAFAPAPLQIPLFFEQWADEHWHKRYTFVLKGLSHEIDFKNFDKNLQNLA